VKDVFGQCKHKRYCFIARDAHTIYTLRFHSRKQRSTAVTLAHAQTILYFYMYGLLVLPIGRKQRSRLSSRSASSEFIYSCITRDARVQGESVCA